MEKQQGLARSCRVEQKHLPRRASVGDCDNRTLKARLQTMCNKLALEFRTKAECLPELVSSPTSILCHRRPLRKVLRPIYLAHAQVFQCFRSTGCAPHAPDPRHRCDGDRLARPVLPGKFQERIARAESPRLNQSLSSFHSARIFSRIEQSRQTPLPEMLRLSSPEVLGNLFREEIIRRSRTKHLKKCNFEGERFLNVTAEIVSHWFQSLDSSQYFRHGEAFRQSGGFLFCRGQVATGDFTAGAQNVRPKLKQYFHQGSAPLNVETLGQRLVIIFAIVQPGAVGRIPITHFFSFQGLGRLRFDLLANLS